MQKFQTTFFSLLSKRHFSTAIKPYKFDSVGTLKDKILLVSGASRGIGLAIAKRAAKDGAHIILLAKKFDEGTRLPGTVFTAADEIRSIGGKALPIECDIRDDAKLREAIDQGVLTFGGIDIVINNASAMNLNVTSEITADQYDLLADVNTRGTFLISKYTAPFLAGSKNPHILNICPPINLNPKWFGRHTAFTISKYGMSMCTLGMSEEFKELGIAVNALWPKTLVTTAATLDLLGKNQSIGRSRTEEVMADAAYVILTNRSKALTGQFFIDEEVLKNVGVTDLAKYKVNSQTKDKDLILNLFLEEDSK